MQRLDTGRSTRQSSLNFSDDHLDCDRVVAAARHDHVRVTLARLDELQMHRLHGREVLVDDLVERPAAIARVTLQTANQANVRICVDEYFDIAKLPYAIVDEKQDSIDDNHIRGLDADRLRPTKMAHEVIFRV